VKSRAFLCGFCVQQVLGQDEMVAHRLLICLTCTLKKVILTVSMSGEQRYDLARSSPKSTEKYWAADTPMSSDTGGSEQVSLRPLRFRDCKAVSAIVRESILEAPEFACLDLGALQKYAAASNPWALWERTQGPDHLTSIVARNSNNAITGYLAVRLGVHEYTDISPDSPAIEPVAVCTNLHIAPEAKQSTLPVVLLEEAKLRARVYGLDTVTARAIGNTAQMYARAGFALREVQHHSRQPADENDLQQTYMEWKWPLQEVHKSAYRTGNIIDEADGAYHPAQYDSDDVQWARSGESSWDNPNRQLFLSYLRPYLASFKGRRILDIGGAEGELSHIFQEHGAQPVCLEPSARHVAVGLHKYPEVDFVRQSLFRFETKQPFEGALAIMTENFRYLPETYKKIGSVLVQGGRLVTIVSDFDRTTQTGEGHTVEVDPIAPGEAGVRITSPRFGFLNEYVRQPEVIIGAARDAGFEVATHQKIIATPDHPRYADHQTKPLFHLLDFIKR
jgi:hypothetical protein